MKTGYSKQLFLVSICGFKVYKIDNKINENVKNTRLIISMNNSCVSTDAQCHNLLKLTNQIQGGLNWTNKKFVADREDIVIIVFGTN